MNKKSRISDKDKQLFRETVDKAAPENKDVIQQAEKKLDHNSTTNISYDKTTEEVAAEDILAFSRSGIQQKLLAKLKSGAMPISGQLDLHGYSADESKQHLVNFVDHHSRAGHRCVLVIHGKGYRSNTAPILKNRVNAWLRQLPQVLAFHSAKPKDGGNGAVYVLLKHL